MRLYFARHGESEANVARVIADRGWTYPLTERGCRQAVALSELLAADVGRTARIRIFSSPLRRAVETAEIVRARLVGDIEVTDALREADCGVMEGRMDPAAWAAHDEVEAAWAEGRRATRIEGGESLDDLIARFDPWLRSVVAAAGPDDRLIAIGHGSLLRFVLPRVVVDRGGRAVAPPQIGHAAALVVESTVDGRLVVDRTIDPGP